MMRNLRLLRIPAAAAALGVAAFAAVALVATPAATGADDGLLRLNLLWTNDVHGHIAPEPAKFMNPDFPPPLGGGASAARYIREVTARAEAAGEEVLLVDVGDMFQGTPIGNKTKGAAVIEYMNAIGYDFAVPGNHDFDLGRENTEQMAKQSKFPWLAANLAEESTGKLVDWVQPTLMIEIGGIRIGVIGIITPGTAHMSFPKNIAGLQFLEMAPTVERYRDQLTAQGADLIFLAIHEGLPYDPVQGWNNLVAAQEEADHEQEGAYGSNYSRGGMNLMELVNAVEGVDFAVGGHTHRGYREPWIDPQTHTMCFESFGNGSSIGHVVLLIDRATRNLVGYEGAHADGTLITLFEDEIWPDPEITEVIRPHHEAAEADMGKVIGATSASLGRGGPGASLVANLVTDAMRERFDGDLAVQNAGGLRADIQAGDLTTRDIFAVLPFGNELQIVTMDGRMIRRLIESRVAGRSGGILLSGARVAIDPTRPDWDRVVELEIGGQPWDPDAEYDVVITDFLMEGNSGLDFLTTIPADKITPTGVTQAEAVEQYIGRHSPVRPRIDDRWVEKPGQAQAPYLAKPWLQDS
ncbi:MAG: bifunctional metallophosphatase/5'-nucleotidase [bacterium]|nr:bifunctional metallophosphatase/5'-nucleotidase [bacterium]